MVARSPGILSREWDQVASAAASFDCNYALDDRYRRQSGRVYRTSNRGRSWEQILPPEDRRVGG